MIMNMKFIIYNDLINFIKNLYPNNYPVQLHAPMFSGNEKKYLNECIDTTFVSYVGNFVTQFEEMTASYTGSRYAVAVVNGTAALQIALELSGIMKGDEVITQPLTFVATANAIKHAGADPIFIDVDLDTMGLSPKSLQIFLSNNTYMEGEYCINKVSGKKIRAVVPVHTFGHPCKIDEIVKIANKYKIKVIEDSAESLGSYYKGKHTGTFGLAGIISYNGNKTITTGGGGMIITDDEDFAKRAKHITTTGKLPHKYEFVHDVVAYNYRMTNVNAAIGVAQMEYIDKILKNKKETFEIYKEFCAKEKMSIFVEPKYTKSNYWLNVIILNNREERDAFLEYSNNNGVLTRPIWRLMNKLDNFKNCLCSDIKNAQYLEDVVVCLPSGVRQSNG